MRLKCKRSSILFAFISLSMVSTALADTKMTVLLDWFINPDHAPLIVAKEKGYFKEQVTAWATADTWHSLTFKPYMLSLHNTLRNGNMQGVRFGFDTAMLIYCCPRASHCLF